MSSRRLRKGTQRKGEGMARKLGVEEPTPDNTYVASSRRDRRSTGERSTPTGLTIGAKTELSTKDILAIAKKRKGVTGQSEHFQRWSAAKGRRKYLSTHSIAVLESEIGKQVLLLKDAGYKTALDVAKEHNYTKLSGIKGIGPAFLSKLRGLLLDAGFTVNWRI